MGMTVFEDNNEQRLSNAHADAATMLSTLLMTCPGLELRDASRAFAALEPGITPPRSRPFLTHQIVAVFLENLIERFLPRATISWVNSRLSSEGHLLSLGVKLQFADGSQGEEVWVNYPRPKLIDPFCGTLRRQSRPSILGANDTAPSQSRR